MSFTQSASRKNCLTALALVVFAASSVRIFADAPAAPILPQVGDHSLDSYHLAFSDEFDGTKLDASKWNYRTDSKGLSTQKAENISVSDGTLKIALKKEEAGGKHFTGGGVISKSEFEHGYYEARMKVPAGAGWHTSFWMMYFNGTGGTVQNEACQELDVIENNSVSLNGYAVNVHKWKGGHAQKGGKDVKTPDLSADFHVFGCEFTPEKVNFYFDGKLVQSVDATKIGSKSGGPVDFPHGPQNIWLTSIGYMAAHKGVDETKLPDRAEFDYVRFFQKP